MNISLRKIQPTLLATGIIFAILPFLVSSAWYDALPRRGDLPAPQFRGDTLLRVALAATSLVFIAFSLVVKMLRPILPQDLIPVPAPVEDPGDLSRGGGLIGLAMITVIALALRVYHMGNDLWLDEINPVVTYRHLPWHDVFTTYLLAGNHQLHTFLAKVLVNAFGEREWIIRIPAVAFGIACVPAAYWFSRFALTRTQSLCIALLLAVSYHMIFFSQNARGYSMHIFFSIFTSGLLVDAMKTGRWRSWILFGLFSFLSFATQMIGAFVSAGQLLVLLIELFIIWRAGRNPRPLLARAVIVYTVLGALGCVMYSVVLPEFLNYQKYFYQQDETSGFRPFSMEFVREMVSGIGAGFGPGFIIGAIPLLLLGMTGFWFFLRRNRPVALMLPMGCMLMAAYLLVRGIPVAPRYFLIAIPAVCMTAVYAVFATIAWIAKRLDWSASTSRRYSLAAVAMVAVVFVGSLPALYRFPKQDYTGAVSYLQSIRRPGEPILVIHQAERGMEYYGGKAGLGPQDLVIVRDEAKFQDEVKRAAGGRIFAVTTLMRNLKIDAPGIGTALENEWKQSKAFPGTIGGGKIVVWVQKTKEDHSERN